MRDTFDFENPDVDKQDAEINLAMAKAGLLHDQPAGIVAAVQEHDLRQSNLKRTTTFRMADGSSQVVPLLFKEVYRDEYTQEALPRSWVESAIQDEIDYFNAKVWRGVPLKQALSDPSAKIIGTRWAVCNKHDADDPEGCSSRSGPLSEAGGTPEA